MMSSLIHLKFWIFAVLLLYMDTAIARKATLDGMGIICPAKNAISSQAEVEHGWRPIPDFFWFDDGNVLRVENTKSLNALLNNPSRKVTNYYSNDKELWFDLGYTYSINLETLQLFRVISMGGETKLRNKECKILGEDSFWRLMRSQLLDEN